MRLIDSIDREKHIASDAFGLKAEYIVLTKMSLDLLKLESESVFDTTKSKASTFMGLTIILIQGQDPYFYKLGYKPESL